MSAAAAEAARAMEVFEGAILTCEANKGTPNPKADPLLGKQGSTHMGSHSTSAALFSC